MALVAVAEHLTPESGLPFGFDPETYRPLKPETATEGLFLAPDDAHVVRLRKLVATPETPVDFLFEDPKTADERLNNARLYAGVTEFHLSILALGTFGMNVPEHATAIGVYPPTEAEAPELTIFSKVPFLAGVSLEETEAVPPEAAIDQMISPLLKYYDWLNTTHQPFFLRDLVAPRGTVGYNGEQYSLQQAKEGPAMIVLHDLGPQVLPRTLGFADDLKQDIFGLADRIGDLEADVGEQTFEELQVRWSTVAESTRVALGTDIVSF